MLWYWGVAQEGGLSPPELPLCWWGIGGGRTGADSGGRPAGSGTIGDGFGEYCAMGGMVESERSWKRA